MAIELNKPLLVLRADGSELIGLGHIYRCIALADILHDLFEVHFYSRSMTATVSSEILRYCDRYIELPSNVDYVEEARLWVNGFRGSEIVVLDGYQFTNAYQSELYTKVKKLICIDDINVEDFCADGVINHVIGTSIGEMKRLDSTQLFLGANFAILRKQFLLAALESRYQPPAHKTFFIAMGGADQHNATLSILMILLVSYPSATYHIVLGKAYSHRDTLDSFGNFQNIQFHVGIEEDELIKLLGSSSLAICPASTISYEVMCLNIPLVTGYISDTQKHVAVKYQDYGIALNVGSLLSADGALINAINYLECNFHEMVQAQKRFFHGQSLSNLRSIFKSMAA